MDQRLDKGEPVLSKAITRLPMYEEELWIVEKLMASLRELLKRPMLQPKEIFSVGSLLHGLSVLLLLDEAVSIDVSVFPIPNSNNLDLSLSLGEGDLTLAVIERFPEPQGTEVICHLVARFCDNGERQFGNQWSVGYWLREWQTALKSMRTRVEISDASDEASIDWSLKPTQKDFYVGSEEDE